MPRLRGVRPGWVLVLALFGSSAPGQEAAPPSGSSLDARSTRLLFAPTARSLPRRRGSFGVAEVVFPWVEVGLLDRASLQVVGVLPVEDLMSGGLILGPKLQLLRKDRVQAAGGVLHAVGSLDSGGLLYGVVTIGGPDAGLTVGVGHGYGGLVDSGGSPDMVFVGGDAVVGKGLRLMAEVYLGGEGLGLPELTLIGGLRWSRGRFSLDLGCVVPVYETGAGTPFPVLSLGLAF